MLLLLSVHPSRERDLVTALTRARHQAVVWWAGSYDSQNSPLSRLVFARTDLSVALVAENSHTAKPMIYKIAGAWGNHEGSMLLWVTVLGLSGGALALLERRLDEAMTVATLAAQATIALGFFAFLLVASNPFARLDPAPAEGQGLNPLLQDPGLAFHPPTLYLGYVGLSVAFSLAVAALLTRQVGPLLARAMRPWVLAAWIFLTLGITAGSYWAYYELGWGGWWFWDPVENASLMPWIAGTALLHSLNVLAARGGLRAWTMMLAVVAFSMSMLGTFLVRSGILTSVHAFAVDPQRGAFILGLLALYIGGALTLFASRIATVREGAPFAPWSRESGLVANNLLLSVILGIAVVLVGTLYPLIVETTTGEKLSVGPPYFDATAGPLALLLVALLLFAPLLRWRHDARPKLARVVPGAVATLVALLLTFVAGPAMALLPRLGLALAGGLAVASLAPLFGRDLRRTPLATWGMVVAHFGVAVSTAPSPSRNSPRRAKARRWPSARGRCALQASSRSPGPTGRRFRPGWKRSGATRACRLRRRRGPSPIRRPKPARRRSPRAGTASSTPCSARRATMAAGSCGCGGSRS